MFCVALAYKPGWVAHCGGAGRHGFYDDGIGSDARAFADRESAQNFRAGADNNAAFKRGMALFAFVKSCSAQRHALINRAVVANHGGFANDNAAAVINEYPASEDGSGVNFDSGQRAAQMRNKTAKPLPVSDPQTVRQTMYDNGVQAGVAGNDFQPAARGGVAL